jgi:folate-binding protein YgfZ
MSSDYQHFLNALGATLDDNGHCQFSNDQLTECQSQVPDNIICPLSHYGLLSCEGPDSAKFLQGQTSCNINDITDQQAQLGAYCTPKGRMISSFLAARRNEQQHMLRMHRDIIEDSKATFGKYIVFSKAELRDDSEQCHAFGLYGPAAKANVAQAFGATPAGKLQVVNRDGQLAIQLDDDGLIFECWLQTDQLAHYWPALSDQLNPKGSSYWQLLTIRQGLADVSQATAGEYIPQAFNYPQIGAVSFNKGCYTGQEIVARMHYRGKPKWGAYRIQYRGPAAEDNTELLSDGSQGIGNIINQVALDEQLHEALAVITHSEIDKPLQLATDQQRVEVLSLPYAITNDAE